MIIKYVLFALALILAFFVGTLLSFGLGWGVGFLIELLVGESLPGFGSLSFAQSVGIVFVIGGYIFGGANSSK